MQFSNTKRAAWLALPLLTCLALPLRARQGPTSEATRIMDEQVAALAALASSPEAAASLRAGRRAELEHTLVRAETALADGDVLASLRPYALVADELAQVLVVFESEPIESLEALAVESDALRERLAALGSPLAGRARRPAALQALLEQAYASASDYIVSAGEQGRETSVRAGVYYLKTAAGQVELAELLAGLPFPPPAEPLGPLPGLTRYLDRLEAELLELYRPPLTQERHATFIELSAGLKLAREMRDADYVLGALERGLEVGRGIAVLTDELGTRSHDRATLLEELARRQEALDALSGDSSLPTLWLADARAQLADETADPTNVAALLERGLDDYLACFEAEAHPASTAAGAPEATASVEPRVTVTLVRWPFT